MAYVMDETVFKVKLRKIGNSVGVILPKDVITGRQIGDDIVITIGDVITDTEPDVITHKQVVGHQEHMDDVITPSDTLKQPLSPYLKEVDSFATAGAVTPEQLCRYCGLPLDQPSMQCSRHR